MRPLLQSGPGLALIALAALAACARCGGAAGPPPERWVAAGVTAAIVVPELRGAARSGAEFYLTAQDFPGTSDLPSLRASISAQLGFDPLDLGALRDAGIDTRRGMAIGFPAEPATGGGRAAPLLVLPVSNRAAAEGLVRRIARDRLGAGERTVEAVGAAQVAVYRQRPGAPPALASADGDDCLLLAAGPEGPSTVARASALAEGDSLAASAAWRAVRRIAGEGAAIIGYVPAGSSALDGVGAVRDGAAIVLTARPRRLSARLVALLGDREAGLRALAGDGAGGLLAARLDPAAALVGRFDGNPALLADEVLSAVPLLARAGPMAAGVDLRRDLFGALAPGAAASASLAPRIDLATLDARTLRRDPLRLVQFELVAPLADPARIAALSDRIVRLAGQRPRPGGPWALPTGSGEVAWTIDDGRLLATGGAPGRLAA
ncbi:MAG TPA: hypothetical protein VLT47_01265, partial [Anaeromyxobacteraceae bacterium]|nr:hypothetical protein [Anaeromyxobacteraceae bacterium]